jgi:hypothetical protein
MGILGLIGVLFVGLKLTGYITWSWVLVTMPFWAMPVLVVGLALAVVALDSK